MSGKPAELQVDDALNVQVETTSSYQRTLRIGVAACKVDEAYERAFQDVWKQLRIKGFRKGKVPEKTARHHLTPAMLASRVVNLVVNPAYKAALKSANLSPLGKPDWEVEQNHPGQDFKFRATVQVMPILKVDTPTTFPPLLSAAYQVSDAQLDAVLQQQQAASPELRETVRKEIQQQAQRKQQEDLINEVLRGLVHNIAIEQIPPQLKEGHAMLALRTRTAAFESQGMTVEQHLASRGISIESFMEELSLTGLVEARLEMLYRSIAAAEGLTVKEGEVNQAISARLAPGQQLSDEVAKRREDGSYRLLAYQILIAKVRKVLLEKAQAQWARDAETKQVSKPKSTKKKAVSKAQEPAADKPTRAKAAKSKTKEKAKSAKGTVKAKSSSSKASPKAPRTSKQKDAAQ